MRPAASSRSSRATRAPETSGEVALHAGTYGYVRGDLYLTGGNDRIAGNLAMSLSRNDGYGTNLFTGKSDQGEVDHSFVARSKWIWRPAASLKLTLAADYQDLDQDFPLPARGRISADRPAPRPRLSRRRPRYAEPLPLPLRRRLAQGRCRDRQPDPDEPDRPAPDARALEPGPRRGAACPCRRLFPIAEQDQFSQEFQLQSGEASPVQWVAGLYYIHLDERYDPTTFIYGGSYSALLGGRIRQTLFASGDASSYAAYGQGTLPIGEATRLTLGLRYTIEDRSVRANGERLFDTPPFVRPIPGLPLLTQEPLRNSDTFDELTWRASLDRHFSDEVMGYRLGQPGLPERRLEPPDPAESRLRPGNARRLRGRPEICRSLAAPQGGCEPLLLRLFRPSGLRAHADRPGDDQRRLRRALRAGAAARRAAGPADGRHLRGAAAGGAVQALSQRDLHQFQRRARPSPMRRSPATSPATACPSRPSSSSMSAQTTGSRWARAAPWC